MSKRDDIVVKAVVDVRQLAVEIDRLAKGKICAEQLTRGYAAELVTVTVNGVDRPDMVPRVLDRIAVSLRIDGIFS